MSAFQYYARIDGLALITQGSAYEYDSTILSSLITPVGLAVHGLAISEADFWQYAETISNANWTDVDL